MKYLQSITVYYWSSNHIAINLKKGEFSYEKGKFTPDYDDEGNLFLTENFKALTHDSDDSPCCNASYVPSSVKDIINTWFENKRTKSPSFIKDFWEDCSQYIRDDQVEMLKSLFEILVTHKVFDDDDELEDGYDDDELPIGHEKLLEIGICVSTGTEKRNAALELCNEFKYFKPLVASLREEDDPIKKKHLILNFVENIKVSKGLGINVSDEANEETMYGKMPLQEWTLPLGDSLSINDSNDAYLDNLQLFGLSAKGLEIGVNRFENPRSIIHHGKGETYYKFFSRYHNCAGYSRFLLEQSGIASFASTNELEKFGVTDPSKYDAFIKKVRSKIDDLNHKSIHLMKMAGVNPEPIQELELNFLAIFNSGNNAFKKLPSNIREILNKYNQEIVYVSYEYKIKILVDLTEKLYTSKNYHHELIDALQKEIRRSYNIPFDAQFKYNHSFELQCLFGFALINVSALVVGLFAIAFPYIIPITLVATAITICFSTLSASASIGMFFDKLKPQRPEPITNMSDLGYEASPIWYACLPTNS